MSDERHETGTGSVRRSVISAIFFHALRHVTTFFSRPPPQVVLTGAKREDNLNDALERLAPVLQRFKQAE